MEAAEGVLDRARGHARERRDRHSKSQPAEPRFRLGRDHERRAQSPVDQTHVCNLETQPRERVETRATGDWDVDQAQLRWSRGCDGRAEQES